MGAMTLAKYLTFNKDSFNSIPCRFFSPHLRGLLVKVLQETVFIMCYSFNVSESEYKDGEGEEACDEFLTCDLSK